MLKSTLNAAKPSEPKRPTLPHLFRNNASGYIALFRCETKATVIAFERGGWLKTGDNIENALGCFDTEIWTPLKPGESVTITVEED